ncbi:hypothetical protein PUNSTDRAFT_53834 [Punctularia strigosozonata HHB-11173 SS5]|uniref:uncharacterized protein n=1 Tax=Punctularia strigosozonata (strain HHB-11173) TaxID=741275 RepID=UPI000441654F|nr:uncharacterized protein PUNSTDRAFT_53834 [Punctularia strigosozonata HHB-11173 SS5]EIN07510.1 hypothetical protein PUNSTDRAFT_53834 [Punctularia strigosozonata HHB-11173 SS5]
MSTEGQCKSVETRYVVAHAGRVPDCPCGRQAARGRIIGQQQLQRSSIIRKIACSREIGIVQGELLVFVLKPVSR